MIKFGCSKVLIFTKDNLALIVWSLISPNSGINAPNAKMMSGLSQEYQDSLEDNAGIAELSDHEPSIFLR